MKRLLLLFSAILFAFQINAENVNINGQVINYNGNAVPNHVVYITSVDSTTGFFYSNSVTTNDAGEFSDEFGIGDITQGEVMVSTESCGTMVSAAAFFNPGNYNLFFTLEICSDSTGGGGGGGGNDTIIGCENFFYYNIEELVVNFTGMVFPENDNATYSWSFGDGTSADGITTSHEYATEGLYEVTLSTYSGGDCSATSYQFVYLYDDSTGGGNDTIWDYCFNYFAYQFTDLNVTFEGFAQGNDQAADFSWDFGDGNSGTGDVVSHDYATEGTYVVVLTTTAGDTCTAISTQTIVLGDAVGGQVIYGSVFIGDLPLDYGYAILFTTDADSSGNGNFMEFRSSIVDSSGAYFFNNVPMGDYLILAFPNEYSTYFDVVLPTYYGDVIFWEEATIISLGNAENPYDINLVPAEGADTGDGQIDGDIVGDGFKGQLEIENVSLFLLDQNNNPLEITYSEVNESFDFSNIEYGTYTIYAEITGLPTEPATVTLSADNPNAEVTIQVDANGATTGFGSAPSMFVEEIGNIYPNPVSTLATIKISMKQQSSLNILIINQIGQIVQSKTVNATTGTSVVQIQTGRLPHGVYNMQVVSDDGASFNQKFIK